MGSPQKVVRAYLNAFLLVGAALVIGWWLGSLIRNNWGQPSRSAILVLQFVSAGMITAATLGFLVDVETWKGQTPAEKVNRGLLRGCYVLGALLYALTASW